MSRVTVEDVAAWIGASSSLNEIIQRSPMDEMGRFLANPGVFTPAQKGGLVAEYMYTGSAPSAVPPINGNGSSTPVLYTIAPPSDEVWVLTNLTVRFSGDNIALDGYGDFGSALTNGCLVRFEVSDGEGGFVPLQQVTKYPLKTTQHWLDYSAEPRTISTGPTLTPHAIKALTIPFKPYLDSGSPIPLDGSLGMRLVYEVRDNLGSVGEHTIQGRGWKEPTRQYFLANPSVFP